MQVKNRIKKHPEFQKVINEGSLLRGTTAFMYYLNNTLGYTRIGISVPKKSGNAVVRNKIKRQTRAICAQVEDYTKSVDIVFIIKKGFDINKFHDSLTDISNLLSKIG